jgi:protein O-mannosyl-transferase
VRGLFAAAMNHATRLILPIVVLALVLAATYVAYLPGLDGPFLLDDSVNIEPARLQELTWRELRSNVFADNNLGGLSRSIGKLSLAVTDFLRGPGPSAFKQENVLLHLANGLLVFWLVRLLFLSVKVTRAEQATWAAVAVSALWLLHPLQVSTVLYVVQRLVLLSAFFSLLALCLYIEGRRLAHWRPVAGTLVMLVGLGVFWPMGILSKENAILLVLVIPLIEWFVLRLRTESARERRLLFFVLTLFIAAPVVIGLIYVGTHLDTLLAGYAGRDFTLTERLLTQCHVLWLYLGLIAVPIPGSMSLYHDGFPIQHSMDATTAAAIAAISATVLLGFLLRRRAPLVGLGILWFFAWHVLESTVMPLELVFEHRNYLALIGPALALVAALRPLVVNPPLRLPLAVGITALVALFGLNTGARAFVWGDLELLVQSDYQSHPNSPRLNEALAMRALHRGDRGEALRYVKRLQRELPDMAYGYLHEVVILCEDRIAAKESLERALELAQSGRLSPGATNLTRRLLQRWRRDECPAVDAAQLILLSKAQAANPHVHVASVHMAALANYAAAAMITGDRDTAGDVLRRLLATAYGHSEARFADAVQAAAQIGAELPTREEAIEFLNIVTADYASTLSERGIRVHISLPQPSVNADVTE